MTESGESKWRLRIGSETYGPYSFDKLKDYVADGRITADSFVARENGDGWQRAADAPELAALFASGSAAPDIAEPPQPSPRGTGPERGTPERSGPDPLFAHIVYGLYAASFVTTGLTSIVGVIIAHVKRGEAEGTWLESHYLWQIRTFWFSLLFTLIGFALMILFIGWFVLVATAVWVIYRVVKGWLRLGDGKPIESPDAFL